MRFMLFAMPNRQYLRIASTFRVEAGHTASQPEKTASLVTEAGSLAYELYTGKGIGLNWSRIIPDSVIGRTLKNVFCKSLPKKKPNLSSSLHLGPSSRGSTTSMSTNFQRLEKEASLEQEASLDKEASLDNDLHPLVNDFMSRDVLSALLTFRFINALSVITFFQPDEYYQSVEPAWQTAFGSGSGAWITWACQF